MHLVKYFALSPSILRINHVSNIMLSSERAMSSERMHFQLSQALL